jgi:lambda family phage portal protein
MFKASFVDPKDAWSGTPVSPDVYISQRQPVLVARSREQWSNNDYVRSFIRQVRQNVVGPHGVLMQAKAKRGNGKFDKDANDAIDAAWKEWGKPGNCEVTGKLSWRALQCLALEHAARDGEFIIRKIWGEEAGAHGFALQMLDPQRLSVKYENYRFGDQGNFIRQGIEFTRYGKPVAYHFTSMDEWDAYYYSINGKGFVRIPAAQILHGFVQEMAGQRRGLPWASTSLFRLHHLQGFEDAAVQNARASASKMGFIEYEQGFGPEADDEADVAGSITAEPLSFHELPEGAKIAEWNPQYPSGEFAVFNKAMLRGCCRRHGGDVQRSGRGSGRGELLQHPPGRARCARALERAAAMADRGAVPAGARGMAQIRAAAGADRQEIRGAFASREAANLCRTALPAAALAVD